VASDLIDLQWRVEVVAHPAFEGFDRRIGAGELRRDRERRL